MSLRDHLSSQFPTVYITFLSILVGLALEDLFSSVKATEELFQLSSTAAVVWLQVLFSLMATIGAWMHYSTVAMLRNSVAQPIDAINILQLTISLFVLNACIGIETTGLFWLAAAFYLFTGALATWGAVNLLKYEERDFSAYIDTMQSNRGPLLLNILTIPSCIIIGYLILQDRLGHGWIIGFASVGCAGVVMWYVIVYQIWQQHIGSALYSGNKRFPADEHTLTKFQSYR